MAVDRNSSGSSSSTPLFYSAGSEPPLEIPIRGGGLEKFSYSYDEDKLRPISQDGALFAKELFRQSKAILGRIKGSGTLDLYMSIGLTERLGGRESVYEIFQRLQELPAEG